MKLTQQGSSHVAQGGCVTDGCGLVSVPKIFYHYYISIVSVVDQGWGLLKRYVEMIGDENTKGGARGVATDSPSQLLACVIEKFLLMNHDPPQWLVSKLKVLEVYYSLLMLFVILRQLMFASCHLF